MMVWTPAQTGAFLDFIVDERLYALFHLVAFRGLRRAEVAGLAWADTDLQGAGTLTVRETRPGSESQADEYDDTKSEAASAPWRWTRRPSRYCWTGGPFRNEKNPPLAPRCGRTPDGSSLARTGHGSVPSGSPHGSKT
ncbi:hypothetical protein ACFQY7_41310 [Actinomadura luteofluorescens]|uniref:hypothetical protein n=1 Tax=Actinomadura luteofluorescens TaxID=46163 RepID=UPI0036377619